MVVASPLVASAAAPERFLPDMMNPTRRRRRTSSDQRTGTADAEPVRGARLISPRGGSGPHAPWRLSKRRRTSARRAFPAEAGTASLPLAIASAGPPSVGGDDCRRCTWYARRSGYRSRTGRARPTARACETRRQAISAFCIARDGLDCPRWRRCSPGSSDEVTRPQEGVVSALSPGHAASCGRSSGASPQLQLPAAARPRSQPSLSNAGKGCPP